MVAVLGAGISGLSLAYYLQKKGRKVVLIEKAQYAGGKIQSFCEDGFIGEIGPNTVLLNNSTIVDLINEIGLESQLVFANPQNITKRYILFKGKPQAIPKGIASAIGSPLLSFSTIGKLLSDFMKKKGNPQKESLANLVKRHFGKEAYENFVVPMLTGIYAGDPEKMDADYVLPFLKQADRDQGSILKGMIKQVKNRSKLEEPKLPKQKIFTFRTGLQQLTLKLAEVLRGNLLLNSEVQSLDKKDGKYQIEINRLGKIETIWVNQVVSTIPTNALAKIKSNFINEIFDELIKIPYVPIVVLHLAYQKNAIGFNKEAFGMLGRPSEKVPFLGVLFNSRFFPHTAPESKELLTVICGGDFNPEITNLQDQDIFKQVESSLEKILSIKSKPIFRKISRWGKAIPQYYLGHEEIQEELKAFEKAHPGFYFSGNYLNGISVSDCVKNANILAEKF